MLRALALFLAVSMTLAGCLSSDEPVSEAAVDDVSPLYADDRITIERLGTADAATQPATLTEPPRWALGEWWDILLTDLFVDGTYNSTRVVAGKEGANFLVGMPTHDFSNALMVLHVPGFGEVAKEDLSFEIHDCRFEPLKFPLELDATWDTQFECRDVTATVIETTAMTATVEFIGPNDHITVVYDATVRAISHFEKDGYARFDVVDHGFAFHTEKPGMSGQVTVPHGHDVIFQHGAIAGALWGGATPIGFTAKEPRDAVDVASSYDRVSFVVIVGNILPNAPSGYYKETATAPDATAYEVEMLPGDTAQFKMDFFKHDAPGGVWNFFHVAGGPGITLSEGIAYHVYEIILPEGTLMPNVGEHQHGDPCAHGC